MRRADTGVVLGLYRTRHDRQLIEVASALGVRSLDTAYSYHGFASHADLARLAGDILPEFMISTKVGFFPGDSGAVHSLDPCRLRGAVDETVDTLGVAPAVVMLHNPERTLAATPPAERAERLACACAALEEATAAGLCQSWGIASWDPHTLLATLTALAGGGTLPRPAVLMQRAGILVPAEVLDAAEELAALLAVAPAGRWGMSPFGGGRAGEVWDAVNVAQFLGAGQVFTPRQAAFRLAYEMPACARVAVGTNSPAHLGELVAACGLCVNPDVIARYRQLLRERSRRRAEAAGATPPAAVSSPVN